MSKSETWKLPAAVGDLVRGLAGDGDAEAQLAYIVRDWALMSARHQGVTVAQIRERGHTTAQPRAPSRRSAAAADCRRR